MAGIFTTQKFSDPRPTTSGVFLQQSGIQVITCTLCHVSSLLAVNTNSYIHHNQSISIYATYLNITLWWTLGTFSFFLIGYIFHASRKLCLALNHTYEVHTPKVGFYIVNFFLPFLNKSQKDLTIGFYNLVQSDVTVFHSFTPKVEKIFMNSTE